ncbi:hypothetical protein V2J09_014986, partial [Rumex salicifolius]
SSNAKKPEFFEDLFCNLTCSEEYRSRTSNKFLRHYISLLLNRLKAMLGMLTIMIENFRTLCVACHADVTAAQCAERKLARRHLNEAIKKLKGSSTRNKNRTRVKSKVQSSSSPEPAMNLDDDEFLLVRVPGSAYTKDS